MVSIRGSVLSLLLFDNVWRSCFRFSFGLSSFHQCTGLDIMTLSLNVHIPNMTQYYLTILTSFTNDNFQFIIQGRLKYLRLPPPDDDA